MSKKIWTAYRWLVRAVWKNFKWVLLIALLTLPLTSMPIILGIVDGVSFVFWQDIRLATNVDTWLTEMKDIGNDWGIPGAGDTFRDFQDKNNDFHVLRMNSNDWVAKLGFMQPQEYFDNVNTPINKFADLDNLMANRNPSCSPFPPTNQWVYIAEWAWPLFSDWDLAFDAAVQTGYVPSSLLNRTRLFYIKCSDTGGFLCGVWGVKAPALVHFSVEDSAPEQDDIEPGLTYSASLSDLRPVTVRIIEFPLKDSYTALPSSVFPSAREQMLAVMNGDKIYQQFEPWTEHQQIFRRFDDYLEERYERKGSMFNYLGRTGVWVNKHLQKPLGLEEAGQLLYNITIFRTIAIVDIFILGPWRLARDLFLAFVGYPKLGDEIFAQDSGDEFNFFDEVMGMVDRR